jgi:hypothetical protein
MNKDVKTALGIKVASNSSTPKLNNLNNSAAKDKTLFGGYYIFNISFTNYIGHSLFGTPKDDKKPSSNNSNNATNTVSTPKEKDLLSVKTSSNNSRTMSIQYASDNISEVDKFIISDSVSSTDIPDFEYNNSEDIRAVLSRFLKSSN